MIAAWLAAHHFVPLQLRQTLADILLRYPVVRNARCLRCFYTVNEPTTPSESSRQGMDQTIARDYGLRSTASIHRRVDSPVRHPIEARRACQAGTFQQKRHRRLTARAKLCRTPPWSSRILPFMCNNSDSAGSCSVLPHLSPQIKLV
jgi:hypothetical protein